MGFSQIITGVTVFVTGLVPASCHKTAATKKTAPSATVASANATNGSVTNAPGAQQPLHDLGEILLTNHVETRINLNGGKACVLTPKQVDSRTIELTLSVETKSQTGGLQGISVTQVTTKSGKPLDVTVGDYELSLTPKMAE